MRKFVFTLFFLLACAHTPPTDVVIKRKKLESPKTQEEVKRLFQEKTNYLQSLYKVRHDPYFGRPDKEESCLRDLDLNGTRAETSKTQSIIFKLKANENFIYGTCDSAQEIYNSELLYLYCPENGRLIEIKIFWPINKSKRYNLDFAQECKGALE